MPPDTPPGSPSPRAVRWPSRRSRAGRALAVRLDRATTRSSGRTLLVGNRPAEPPGASELVRAPADPARLPDGPFDTIVAPLVLAVSPEPRRLLEALAARLDHVGSLWFVEPTRRPGGAGRFEERLAPWCVRHRGLRPDLDVPAMMRDVGLTVVDVERFVMRTVIWPLRHTVAGRATIVGYPTGDRVGGDGSYTGRAPGAGEDHDG
ncbi:MAG: hypothetical protein S0880_22900 [Actinomycetota bacterium]|nr:hypothetical protein [Actinomycetota bacterium]